MLCERIPMSKTNPRVWMDTYVLEDSSQFDTGITRPAVLVLPGGGYTFTSDREAEFIALEFNTMGCHAFVLRYSVGKAALVPAPILDGFRAIAAIRDNAEKWHVAPDKLAVCGFSAGGHLAAGLMTMWKGGKITQQMGCEPSYLRPDAGILCYALLQLPYKLPPADTGVPAGGKKMLALKLESEFKEPQHPDWQKAIFEKDGTLWIDTAATVYLNCFGSANPSEELLRTYSMVKKVDCDTPPAFLWTTTPDDLVPAADSAAFAQAMLQKGRPVELHIFGSGEHGLSLARTTTGSPDNYCPAERWTGLAAAWLKNIFDTTVPAQGSPFAENNEADGASFLPDEEKPVQYYENIYADRAGMFSHSPFSMEQRLVRYVMDGDEKAALETLNQINKQGAKAVLAKDPLRSLKNSIICSCTFLTRAAIQAGVSDEEAFALSDAAIQHIETLESRSLVLAYETSMLVQVIRLVKKHSGKSYSTPVRRAIHYVDSHLDEPLQLSKVAEYVKIHPNYLSKRFKQETGTTISAYATARKIHEAAYFVQHTDYPMTEIAGLYGFSSQSYFISSFKKVLGKPPGEYRNSRTNF